MLKLQLEMVASNAYSQNFVLLKRHSLKCVCGLLSVVKWTLVVRALLLTTERVTN